MDLQRRVADVLGCTGLPRSSGDGEEGYVVERFARQVSVRWQHAGSSSHTNVMVPRGLQACGDALRAAGLDAQGSSGPDHVYRVIVRP